MRVAGGRPGADPMGPPGLDPAHRSIGAAGVGPSSRVGAGGPQGGDGAADERGGPDDRAPQQGIERSINTAPDADASASVVLSAGGRAEVGPARGIHTETRGARHGRGGIAALPHPRCGVRHAAHAGGHEAEPARGALPGGIALPPQVTAVPGRGARPVLAVGRAGAGAGVRPALTSATLTGEAGRAALTPASPGAGQAAW